MRQDGAWLCIYIIEDTLSKLTRGITTVLGKQFVIYLEPHSFTK